MFYRNLEAKSNAKQGNPLGNAIVSIGKFVVNGCIQWSEDRTIDPVARYGYPAEFVTGREYLSSEDLEQLNKKVFGDQRQIDIIYTMRYATDEEFRKAIDEDNAINWEVEAMRYVAKEYLFSLSNTIININNSRLQSPSDSEFAQYDVGIRLEPYELTHKTPIAYQNQRTFKNTSAQTRVGLDASIELVTWGAGKYLSSLKAGSAVDDTAQLWDDVARYVDEFKGSGTGVGNAPKVNIDTGTANAFVSEDSPLRHQLKSFVDGKQMVMTDTAVSEFKNIVNGVGGPLEQARAQRFLNRVNIIPDSPSTRSLGLQTTKKVGANDITIFGTGDNLGITTMTSDAKFVRGAQAQGVDFDIFVHDPVPLTKK